MNRELLKLAILNILSNLTIPLVSLVDVGLMGHLANSSHIVAIGFGVMIFNFVYWSFGFLRMGTTGVISQAFGSEDTKGIVTTLQQSLFIALIGASLLLFSQHYLYAFAEYLISAESSVNRSMSLYFEIRIWAAPATIVTYVFTGWFLGMQNSKAVLYLTLVVNLANAFFSYLFVVVFNYGIQGVAAGTLIAQYLGLVFCIIYLRLNYRKIALLLFKFSSDLFGGFKSLMLLNGNIFIRTFVLITVLSFFKTQAGNISIEIGAANILLLEFVTISAYGIDGFAFAAESISGKYFGKGNRALFLKSIRVSFLWGLMSALVFSIVFILFGKNILGILTDKQMIIDFAIDYLPWLIIAPLVNSIAFVWDGIYIGATASKLMRNSMIFSGLIFFVLFYFLDGSFGNHGIWLSLTLFMLCRGIIQTILFKTSLLKSLALQ